MLATTLERDPHLGRLLTGRIESGSIRPNETIQALAPRRQRRSSRRG